MSISTSRNGLAPRIWAREQARRIRRDLTGNWWEELVAVVENDLPAAFGDVVRRHLALSELLRAFRMTVRDYERLKGNGVERHSDILIKDVAMSLKTTAPVDLSEVAPTPREWVVRDVIPARHVTNLYADSGVGKSYLALYLAMCTLTGKPFAGHPVRKSGLVLYLDGELDAEEQARRWWAVARGAGLEKPPAGLVYKRFDHPLLGEGFTFVENLAQNLDPALVIVDSVGKAVGKPLDADAAIALYAKLDALPCAVLAIDHTPKPFPDMPADGVREFGSAYKRHYARSAFLLERHGTDGSTLGLVLKHQKSSFGRLLGDIHLAMTFTEEAGEVVAVAFDFGAAAVENIELFGTRGEVLRAIRERGEATIADLMPDFEGVDRRTLERHVSALKRAGYLDVAGKRGKSTIYTVRGRVELISDTATPINSMSLCRSTDDPFADMRGVCLRCNERETVAGSLYCASCGQEVSP